MIKEAVNRVVYKVPKAPSTVQFEVTNRCNLNCKMCPRKYLNVEYKDMKFSDFKKTVDNLAKNMKEIVLTGWGEPLVHPKLIDMIKYCKKKRFKVRLTTNGLLLNKKMQEKIIKSGLDKIVFSIDSIEENVLAHWNVSVLDNIEQLLKLKGKKKPEIVLQTTLHKNREKDVYDVIRYAAEKGVKYVNLARLDIRFKKFIKELKRPTINEEKKIFRKAEALGNKLGVQVDFVPLALFYGLNRKLYKLFRKSLHRFGKFCPKTFDYCYVNFKGFVTPCCNLPHLKIGDLKTEKIKKIWNNNEFMLFRKNQKKICAGCDVLEIK